MIQKPTSNGDTVSKKPFITDSNHLQVAHFSAQEIDTSHLMHLDRQYPNNLMTFVPTYNENQPACSNLKRRFQDQMTPLTRSDIQKLGPMGSIGINQWVSHYNEGQSDATPFGKPAPNFFKNHETTKYFTAMNEDWDDLLQPGSDNNQIFQTMADELNARNTVIHTLLQMLNFATTPTAVQIAPTDPYTTPRNRTLINKEIAAFHSLPRDAQAILIAQYIHSHAVNERNCDRFNTNGFSAGGRTSRSKSMEQLHQLQLDLQLNKEKPHP